MLLQLHLKFSYISFATLSMAKHYNIKNNIFFNENYENCSLCVLIVFCNYKSVYQHLLVSLELFMFLRVCLVLLDLVSIRFHRNLSYIN